MTSQKLQIIATWLNERGFNEAAFHLLRAYHEVEWRISDAEHLAWLNELDELKEARRTSGNGDDLPSE